MLSSELDRIIENSKKIQSDLVASQGNFLTPHSAYGEIEKIAVASVLYKTPGTLPNGVSSWQVLVKLSFLGTPGNQTMGMEVESSTLVEPAEAGLQILACLLLMTFILETSNKY